jgi:2-polyprenyl-6-methoxyphenol hydroxylase-like FAD-dependent oxidoreductase
MDEFDADVAIVGCGPTGALLAILLAQRGWRVQVLERWLEPYPLPRAVHFDHEVGRILQSAGLAGGLSGRTEPASVYEWRNAAGETLLRIGRDPAQSLSGWPESNMFHQPELEAILDARVGELPGVTLRRGCELTALEATPDGVALRGRGRGGETVALRARYAVGCDGANSRVREAIGVAWHDLGFRFDWLVADVTLGAPRAFEPMNWQLCDPARPTTIVSGGPGRRRWEFMRLPSESTEVLSLEESCWRLLAAWDVRPDNAKLLRHSVYTFRACWAEQWRRGRVLLAGDAAHLMPPFAGQGLCSGARDAANLAWKLDLVLSGRAGDALLDGYESERMPHARSTIETSVALGEVICVADPVAAAARDARMRAQVGDPIAAPLPPLGPGCFADTPHARELCVHPRLGSGWLDDVAGNGFVLMSVDGDPRETLGAERLAWFATLGGTCVHVDDADGRTTRWFRERGIAVALQRPDFAVFGTAPTLARAPALVEALREKLTSSLESLSDR